MLLYDDIKYVIIIIEGFEHIHPSKGDTMGFWGWVGIIAGIVVLAGAAAAFWGRESFKTGFASGRERHARVHATRVTLHNMERMAGALEAMLRLSPEERGSFFDGVFPEGTTLPAPITNTDVDGLYSTDRSEADANLHALIDKIRAAANQLRS